MIELDVTKTNREVDRLLEVTDNPRHRFLLRAYRRHRSLEMAGRYEEIFAPEMTVENPVYHFNLFGIVATLEGREQVEGLYREWSETGQCVFYIEWEHLAVGDRSIASTAKAYQQGPGKALAAAGIEVDDGDATYLVGNVEHMIWPYDDRGRLIGEDVWEVDPSERELIKLESADVLAVALAAEQLNGLIETLPSFDEAVLAAERAAA